MTPQMINTACTLAELGYRVFPCVAGEKIPATPNGCKAASLDMDTIDNWWTASPAANIGLSTDGLLVVDVDVIDGKPNPWLDQDRYYKLYETCGGFSRTPRGGSHFFYRAPEGVELRNTAGKIAPGIDTRATGGYVLVAPSRTASGDYQWITELNRPIEDLPVAPQWLLDLLEAKPSKPITPTATDTIPNGQRNASLTSMAGSMRRAGMTADEILAGLHVANKRRCVPPLGDTEVKQIAESVSRYQPASTGNQHDFGEVRLVRVSDVPREEIRSLWPFRIPMGKLTLICGDPGLGKSTLTADIAARVSTGANWPDGAPGCEPGSVILFSAEDDVADTIRPRLERAGANLDKVLCFESVTTINIKTGKPERRGFSLADDLPIFEEQIKRLGDVRMLVIDPISSYCGKVDSHKNGEVRTLLAPLAELAGRYDIAVVCITHMSKGVGGKSIYRATGSLAFAAAARVVTMLAADYDDPERRLLLPVKANIYKQRPGLAFRIESDLAGPFIAWDADGVDMTADQFLAGEAKKQAGDDDGGALAQAVDFLREILRDGPVLTKDLDDAARANGFATSAIKRARAQLGVKARKQRSTSKWEVHLPDQTEPHEPHALHDLVEPLEPDEPLEPHGSDTMWDRMRETRQQGVQGVQGSHVDQVEHVEQADQW